MRKLKQWHLITNEVFLQLLIYLMIYMDTVSAFEFKAPYVSVNPTTINTLAQYTMSLQRQFTQDISSTPWNTQLVPAGAQLTVTFPIEFVLSGGESCDMVLIGGNMVSTFSFASVPSNRTIIVSGAINAAQYISDVTLVISNVLNPSPALTTSAFLATIGSDSSANDPFAAVTLTPGSFGQPMASFSPSTVNTTGNLIITVTLANKIPLGSAFTVTFPSSLSWAEDVAGSSHKLPLGPSMSCSSLSSSLNSGLSCSGQIANQVVTIVGLSNVDLPALSVLNFSVNNLFSPPTQNRVDNLVVTSVDFRGYQIDTSTLNIQGLVAKVFTDLTIVSTTASKPINSNIGLRISFTLLDTVTNADYFEVQFPAGTVITYTTSLSTFSIATASVTYNSNTGVMSFTQTALSQVRFAGFLANITFLTYRTPNSTKPTDPILFRVMKNGFAKMKGAAIPFVADPKLYTFAVTPNDTRINMASSYTIALNLADGLDKTGYIVLTVPPQLIIAPSLSVSIVSSSPSSINLAPTVTPINSTAYRIWNLNKTAASLIIPVQNLNITIGGVQNPNAGMTISNFTLSIYYSNENYLTATAMQSNAISVAGGLLNASVASNTNTTASTSDLQVSITIQNSIPVLGRIIVTIPPEISYSTVTTYSLALLPSLTPIPLSALSLPLTSPTISFQLTADLAAGSTVKLTLLPIITPASTQSTSLFSMATTNQNNVTIDSLGTCSCRLTMISPSSFTMFALSRGSGTNWDSTVYNVSIGMPGLIPTGASAWVNLTFPVEVNNSTLLSTLLVSTSANTTQNISATVLGSAPLRISIALPGSVSNLSNYYFSLSSIQNPASLKPTLTGLQAVVGITSASVAYLCSKGETLPIQNTQTADFPNLSYAYTSGFLFAEANFTSSLGLVAGDRVAYLSYQLDNSLRLRDPTVSVCSSPQLAVTCSVLSTAPSIVKIVPTSASTFSTGSLQIMVGIVLTPTAYSPTYSASTLTSYDSSNFAVSRNSTLIKFSPTCSLPCRECVASQPTQCLSCYSASSNVTSLIYFAQTVNQTYGGCYSACPTGYFLSTGLCVRCSNGCLQCTSGTVCTSCPGGSFLNTASSTCVSTCPTGTFPSGSVCAACPLGCSQCSSATICSSCTAGYFLYNSACLTSCPASYTIANSSSLTCDPCSASCTTCAMSPTSCTSCSAELVLASGGCVSSCPNINMIPINGTCTSCSSTCATCSLGISNCTSCNISNINNRYLYYLGGQCLPACPSLYYGTSSNGYRCVLCSSLSSLHCANCTSDGLACLSCDAGYIFMNSQCLSSAPDGYVNISGIATPCLSPCFTCSITTSNCTSCLSSAILYNSQCISQCPSPLIFYNSTCTPCSAPCATCSSLPSRCTSCASPYFLNTNTFQCVGSSGCQTNTYPNSISNTCSECISPCLSCSTAISCSSCVHGFYFESLTTLCLDVCPLGWVGVVDVCIRCTSPCRYCMDSPDKCTSCVSGYYWNSYTFQCLLQCPALVSIPNPVSMTCQVCVQPCLTCQNLTSLCLSCNSTTFLYGNQCVTSCPTRFYGEDVSRTCRACDSSCLTCRGTATTCLSCPAGSNLYLSGCITECPPTHAIVVAHTCQLCIYLLPNCVTCTSSQCLSCDPSYILMDGQCYSQCPSGYTLSDGSCIATANSSVQQLTNTLSSSGVFPLPWTCIGVSLFIACLMSKMQNKNTYLLGAAYSVSGLLETGSLVFMVIKYIAYHRSLQATEAALPAVSEFPVLAIGLIIILILNLTSLVAQTPLLVLDSKFQIWLHKHTLHRVVFALTTILSLLINYKIRLIIFSKLFSSTSTRAQLESVQKFRIFNILSFLGVSHEIFVIYMASLMISRITTQIVINEMFLIYIDGIVVCLLAMGLSIATNKKEEDFFTEIADNGYVLNKKIMAEGDDLVQEGIEARHLRGEENKQSLINHKNNQMDSFQKMIEPHGQQIYQDEELSLSISENRSEVDRREKQKQRNKQQQSQHSGNIFNNSKTNTKKNPVRKTEAKMKQVEAHEETANPINRAKYQLGDKLSDGSDEANNHALGNTKSVIFQQTDKQQIDEQAISKNQTMIIENSSKAKEKEKDNEKLKSQQSEKSSKKINNFVQQNSQPKQAISNKKQIETKIFREAKEIGAEDNSDEIQSKIQKKMKQLQTLKRENSSKAIRKSREKSRQKSRQKQASLEPSLFQRPKANPAQAEHKANLDQQKLKERQEKGIQKSYDILSQNYRNDVEVELEDNEATTKNQNQIKDGHKDNGQSEAIPEVSMLIRQEKQLKHQMLQQQKKQDVINEDIQFIASQTHTQTPTDKKNIKTEESQLNIINQSIASQSKKQDQKETEQRPKTQAIEQEVHLPNTSGKTDKLKQKQHESIQNMYDSILRTDENRNNKESSKDYQPIGHEVQEEKSSFKRNDYRDIAIGDENVEVTPDIQNNNRVNKIKKNIFEFESDANEEMEDSGLEDSRPDHDEEINHRPLRSSIDSDMKGAEMNQTKDNSSAKHPLVGIIHTQPQRNQMPRMADEQGVTGKHHVQKPEEEKTMRKTQQRPPLQRPGSTQKNRIYAAGLRQLEDQTITKKHSNQNPLQEKRLVKKSSLQQPSQQNQLSLESSKKRNGSLYNVPLSKLESHESKESSSRDHTEDILIRPGGFNQSSNLNSSSEGVSFVRSNKYTSTINVGDNEVPQKPTISHNATARAKFNDSDEQNRASTSHQRGGRNRMMADQNAMEDKFSTKKSMDRKEEEGEEGDEDLDQFYGRSRQKKSKSPKRSRSKERNPSKQSIKKMKELEKVYLQRLDLPKRRQ